MSIGLTEISATSVDAVSAIVQETLKQEAFLLPTVMDHSNLAVKGVSVVKVPRRNQFAAADKTENTDLTVQIMTFDTDDIALDKYKAIYTELEDNARIQATPDVEAQLLVEMAKELALQVDRNLIAQIEAASAAAPDHRFIYDNTSTDTIQQTDILEANRLLNVAIVPRKDRFMLIGPDQEKEMLLLSDFVRADSYGSSAGLREAELGRIYGFTVMMHTEVTPNTVSFYHKSHVGYAAQMGARFDKERNVKGLLDEFALSWLYGTQVLDTGKRGVILNTTGA